MQRNYDATKLVTPAAYARLKGLNKSTISRQIARGIIPAHGGKVDPEEADQARRDNLNQSMRRNKPSPAPVDLDYILNPEAAAYRKLFDEILSRRHLVPGILAAIGVRDPVLLHCADDVFAALVCDFAEDLNDLAYDWGGTDDLPLVDTPIKDVFKRHKIKLTKEITTKGDKMADDCYLAIEKALGGTR
jgi:hypothetical protein